MMEGEYSELIQEYIECFGKGPPTWELPIEEAIRRMKKAIETGEEMEGVDLNEIPSDAYL